jgi:hypothetical protein
VAYVFIESAHPDSVPGYYTRIDQGEWERSYSFKMGTYRDITLIFYEGKKQTVVKTFEPGWDENFHSIDIKVGDNNNWLTYKPSALTSTSFRKLSIRTKNK